MAHRYLRKQCVFLTHRGINSISKIFLETFTNFMSELFFNSNKESKFNRSSATICKSVTRASNSKSSTSANFLRSTMISIAKPWLYKFESKSFRFLHWNRAFVKFLALVCLKLSKCNATIVPNLENFSQDLGIFYPLWDFSWIFLQKTLEFFLEFFYPAWDFYKILNFFK